MVQLLLVKWCRKHSQLIFIFLISALVIFIYRFPDIYAYVTTPLGIVFLGQDSWFDPQDINSYAGVIHYAQSGYLLLPNVWTALLNQPIIIFPVEQLLGFIFRFGNPYLLFWIASVVCGIILIIGMYHFVRRYISSDSLTALTVLGISLGGGLGVFLYPSIPSFDISNGITFYETFFKPHEAISILLYIYSTLTSYELFINNGKRTIRNLIFLSIALSVSFLIYPYLIALYLVLLISFFLVFKQKLPLKNLLLVMILPCLSVVFVAYQLSLNPGFYEPFMQHLSTPFLPAIYGYGVLLPVFIFQLFFMKKTLFMKYLSCWIICAFVLAFLPIGPGKIFLRGLFFPLVFVDVLQLQILLKKFELVPLRYFYWGLFFVLVCMTNCYIMYLRLSVLQTPQATDIIYMPQDEYRVFDYLNSHSTAKKGVLAGEIMSNLIPAYTDDRSCIGGLWSFNAAYTSEVAIVNSFYAGKPVSKNYLRDNNISYVLWGPSEQQITARYARGNITDLRQLYKNLKLVYQTSSSNLYQVR